MRTITLTSILLVAYGYAANAQKFTILPQIGLENSRTTLRYNDLPSIAPIGGQLSPQLGARLNVSGKKGHGAFFGIATSRSVVSYNFSDPENGMNIYNASADNMKMRFEGGYQFSSKPIFFSKRPHSNTSSTAIAEKAIVRKTCGGYTYIVRTPCGQAANQAKQTVAKNPGWSVSIQPFIGAASVPSVQPNVDTKAQGYEYRAGNWDKAVIAGSSFEFGKNLQRKFTVTMNYLKGIGNLGTETVTSTSGTKTSSAYLKSGSSSWNFTVGVPITLYKNKAAVKSAEKKSEVNPSEKPAQQERKCGQYFRCRKAA